MNALRALFVVLVCASLGACAASGNGKMTKLTTRSANELLTPGKTTRQDVLLALGEAATLRFESGYEVWVYTTEPGARRLIDYAPVVGLVTRHMPRSGKELRILFDPQGIVRKYLLLDIAPEPQRQEVQ